MKVNWMIFGAVQQPFAAISFVPKAACHRRLNLPFGRRASHVAHDKYLVKASLAQIHVWEFFIEMVSAQVLFWDTKQMEVTGKSTNAEAHIKNIA